ncbi:MAG TPA: hypothetical protein PKY82_13330 [Pyrinomonadaceae bacterium]|nr:hypothetical protein [Pyrinomonadaceae bacterium]
MKFVSGIHTFAFEENKLIIDIPYYHRTSTGLLPETTVYLYPRITDKNKVHEVIMTPFHPEDWANIWRLELNAKDRPGLIKEITRILSDERINILVLESLITNHNHESKISILAKFDIYFKKQNLLVKENITQKNYFQKIKATFDEATNGNADKVDVKRFEPIKFLFDNSNIFSSHDVSEYNYVEENRRSHYFDNRYQGTTIKDKKVEIDNRLIEDLGLKKYSGDSDDVQGIIFSDTEDKFILVRFFSKDQLIVYLEITYDVFPYGVIFELAETIHNVDENFNLISCYNRIRNDRNNAVSYFMVDVTSNPEQINLLIAELKAIINPVRVIEVRILNYSRNFREIANKLNIDLQESEEEKNSTLEKRNADQEKKEDLSKLLEKSEFNLAILERDKQHIEFHVDRELKNKIILLCSLISISIIGLVIVTALVKWEILEPIFSIVPNAVWGILFIYSIIKGVDFQVSKNNDETRNAMKKQWIEKRGYEIEGDKSLEQQIINQSNEISEYKEQIARLEDKIFKRT